jgi:hypothetical protein
MSAKKLVSVSSVINFTGGPPPNWYIKVQREAYEKVKYDFDEGRLENLPAHIQDANDIMNHSKMVGRVFHANVRQHIDSTFDMNGDTEYIGAVSALGGSASDGMVEAAGCYAKWLDWWEELYKMDSRLAASNPTTEVVLSSEELGVEGRCDCLIAGNQTERSMVLFDWKSSDRCYTNDYLEVAAYAGLLAKSRSVVTDEAYLVRCPKGDAPIQIITLSTEKLVHGWGIFKVLLNAKLAYDEYEKMLEGGAK